MIYELRFSEGALKQIERHKKAGNKSYLNKLTKLLEIIRVDPFGKNSNVGKFEVLKGSQGQMMSRRIDKYNRLVYYVENDIIAVIVVSSAVHYVIL